MTFNYAEGLSYLSTDPAACANCQHVLLEGQARTADKAVSPVAAEQAGTGFIAVALLGEPIGSTILAYIIFDEGLTWLKLAGGVFILSAIYVAALGEKK